LYASKDNRKLQDMPTLRIKEPSRAENVFRLEADAALFGRTEECDLVLGGEGVSRRHGRFFRDQSGQWWVEDLQSKNGILLEGHRITRHRLADGDVLSVGEMTLTFLAGTSIWRGELDAGVTLADLTRAADTTIERAPNQAATVDARRLGALYKISKRLLNQRDVGGLIDAASSELSEALKAGVVVFGLTCDPEHHPDQLFVRPATMQRVGVTLSLSILRRTLDAKRSILIADTHSDANLQMAQSIVSGNIHSALCVPLMRDQAVTGFMYVDSRKGGWPYKEQDLDFASAVGAMVGTAVENARLNQAELARQRMEAELSGARRVQEAIMPSHWPEVDGWEIHGRHQMCHEVGGDYYDAIPTEDGRLWLVVADVSGKGAAAALLASSAHAGIHALVDRCTTPAELLTRLNRLMRRRPVSSSFVTCLAIMLESTSPTIQVASAGHPPPAVVPATGTPAMMTVRPGFMLGAFDDPEYENTIPPEIRTGESFVMYTDGVTEAMDPNGNLFGETGLLPALEQADQRTAPALVNAAVSGVEAFREGCRQSDDLVLLACRRTR